MGASWESAVYLRLLSSTILGLVVAIVFLGVPAGASSIGPSCGTCQGSGYTITYSATPIATTPTTDVWEIAYSIDTTGYAGGGAFLDTVSLKVSSSIVMADLVSAPGGVANWVEILGGLNGSGCSGAGSGFDCATAIALSPTPVPAGTYTWLFQVEVARGGLFLGVDQSSVKARYVDSHRHKVGALVSEGITLSAVPEPSTAMLVLLGAGVLGARRSHALA